jgi:DNA polymerase family A
VQAYTIPESLQKRKWTYWKGEKLGEQNSPTIVFDTETDMPNEEVSNSHRSRLVVLTATDGSSRVVVAPEQVPQFVQTHQECLWVAHNLRFDFWSVYDELERRGGYSIPLWVSLADSDRMRCTMLLDFLIRLATCRKPDALRMRGLGDFKEYGIVADKHLTVVHKGQIIDVRTGFGNFLGKPITDIPLSMLDYAVWDTVAGYDLYQILAPMAEAIRPRNKYGVLTDELQIRSDIVLSQIGHTGIAIDQNKVDVVSARMWAEIQEIIKWLDMNFPMVLDHYSLKARSGSPGTVKLKRDTGLPALKEVGLLHYLSKVMEDRHIPLERIPKTAGSKNRPSHLTLSLQPWMELAKGDPFVDKWARYSILTDMHGKVRKLKGQKRMYADYRVLKVTGRTSCTGKGGGVNIQAWDRDPEMRSLFVAEPGHKLVIVDYSAVELRTLAAVCINRFGKSTLAEVFKKGIDPHAYTAAMFQGIDPLEFMDWKRSNPDRYKRDRQAAKPINFGVPGGLGPVRLSGYAHAEYGISISVQEAGQLRDKLITEVYPEIGLYLRDRTPWILGRNLGLGPNEDLAAATVIDTFQPPFPGYWYAVQKIVGFEDAQNMKNESYSKNFKQGIWTKIKKLNRNPDLRPYLAEGKPCAILRRLLFGDVVETLTGRIRAGVDYGEARNTPFQGLAADGSKVAMWEIFKAEYRLVAFIHDEMVVEVREEKTQEALEDISRIMIKSMESVVGYGIPIEVEGKVSPVWCK